jgi:TolB-like protein
MRNLLFLALFGIFGFGVFAQQKPIAVIAPFTSTGGPTDSDVETITELFISQIVSQNSLTIVDRGNLDAVIREMRFQVSDWADDTKAAQLGMAVKAQYLIRGRLMKMSDQFFLSATILDIEKLQIAGSATKQFSSLDQILTVLPDFSKELVEGLVPSPLKLLAGTTWRGSGANFDHELICILRFNDNGTITVERYDTQESRGVWNMTRNTRIITGSGIGTYTISENRDFGEDFYTLSINLSLQNVLSKYRTVRFAETIPGDHISYGYFMISDWPGLECCYNWELKQEEGYTGFERIQ